MRRVVHALIIVLTLIVGATAAVIVVTQTAWFKNWLRGYVVREAHRFLNGQVSIQRLGGNLFFGIEMEGVAVSLNGSEVVSVKDLGLDYSIFELVSRGLFVDEIRLNQPTLYLRREGDAWSIARLIKKQENEADRQGPAYPIAIGAIGISDASIVVDDPAGTSGLDVPNRFDRLDAQLSFEYEPVHFSIEINHASFRGTDPAIGLNSLSGGVSVRDDTVFLQRIALRTEESSVQVAGAIQHYLTKPIFNLQMSSDKLSVPEIANVLPALAGVWLQPAFELTMAGPADELAVELNVRSSAGDVTGKFVADVAMPGQAVQGTVSVRHLNLAPIVNDPRQRTDLTADARLDLRATSLSDLESVRGTVSVNVPRLAASGYTAQNVKVNARVDGRRIEGRGQAAAYGAEATAAGRLTLPKGSDPLSYDLRGRARHLDLRRLPPRLGVPPAETHVDTEYHVRGIETPGRAQARVVDGDLRFDDSTVAGARIAGGGTAQFSIRDQGIAYQADVTVSGLDLQRVGRDFSVPALEADRYKSTVNGHVRASGHGSNVRDREVAATGTLSDSTILGGRVPQMSFDIAATNDTAHVKANGAFADFDPAALTGKPVMKGAVTGSLDVDAMLEGVSAGVTADNVNGTARVALEKSTIGGLAIDRAILDGDYRDRSGEIRQFEMTGRDLHATASGTLTLKDTGESNLAFQADSPRLEELGKIVDVPVSGLARIDGTVTGNGATLRAAGTLTGGGLKYGDNGALSLSAAYSARVPDLDVTRAEITADMKATFVTVAGQEINELTAKTTYASQHVEFDATARQPQRSLSAAGSMALHPDHREVHLERMTLDTQGLSWQMAPASQATVQYLNAAMVVRDLELVSGDQQIAADGTFGRPGDALKITMRNVDLAAVDALLLRPPQFSGRVDATGTLRGTAQALQGDAEFKVNKGSFRTFQYETFAGTVDYKGQGLTVDARLQQNATQWLTAKGYVPRALFTPGAGAPIPSSASHDAVVAPEDRVDLTIDSSPIDLGVIQGFNDMVTGVKGTLEAHLRVTGSVADPHPIGEIAVRDGSMTVVPVGVSYKNIAGRIELQQDRVHIDQITVLDNHDNALSVTGDLAVHERQVGDMHIYVTADDFKIVDNKLGNLRIHSRVEVAGELRSPRLEGYLGVSTGQINVDEIVDLTGPGPYATEPARFGAASASASEPASMGRVFERLQMDVQLTVPNDLVVKAGNLQVPDAPIGLGALTVTLGGDLRALKDPGGRVRLVGTVNTIRGSYDFQGRRFEILRGGSIRFNGLDDFDPALDIRARRIIQAVEAIVNVRGTLKQPEIALSSVPPLEQADILSLIVFNQPINQLGEGQQISLTQRAQALATGAVAGQLAMSIGRALNLDTFEIDVAPEGGGGPALTIGQQLGQDLYVKVEQGIGEQGSTNFILEYELTDWLRLQANVLQGASTQQSLFRRAQGSGADLIFFFSF